MAQAAAGVKLSVTGIAQFKQNISTARNQIKTMDADLALIEKQFKQSGDAEEYMKAKTEVLKGKLEQQKTVIAETEKALETMQKNGVSPANAAFQNMQQQLLRAKGDLIDTENAMAGISDKGEDAAGSVNIMNQRLSEINRNVSFENVVNGLEKITDGMGKVITKAWQVGKAIVNATLGAGEWADELQTTADQYEIPPEKLYKMRQVAQYIDSDAETILQAQDKLSKNASKESKSFMGALAKLNIDPTGLTNDQLFWQAGKAIEKLGKEEDKTYYATEIFGKSWRELIPLFKAGEEEYRRMMEEASWIGDDNFQALTQLDDASHHLNDEWETLQKTFLGTLAGPMTDVMGILTGLLQEFNAYLQTEEGKKAMEDLGTALTGWVDQLKDLKPEDVINTVKEGFEWIVNNASSIVSAIEGFGIAFAGLKLAELGINIGRVINGFESLLKFGKNGGTGGGGTDTVTGSGGSNLIYGAAGRKIGEVASGLQVNAGNLMPVADWALNNTAPGRQLQNALARLAGKEGRFGDEDVFGDIKHNVETFEDDLRNNVITSPFVKLGENNIRFWDQVWNGAGELWNKWTGNAQLAGENTHGDDWTAEDALAEATAKATEQTADLTGATEAQEKATTNMKNATDNLRNMPAEMRNAVIEGMSGISINIDGQSAGNIMAPYIGGSLGLMVLNNP